MASAIDEDTKRAVASGRATLGSMLGSARDDLQKAFFVFVVGFIGTFYLMRIFIWDRLKADLNPPGSTINAITPFDVILLQAKIGIAVGILITIPVLVYYGRDALRARGRWPAEDIPRWKFVFPGILAVLLFIGGVAYAYYLFFPLMLGFLANNASAAGFEPAWSIVMWTEFVAFLSLSFGLAAQLPLVMSLLTYLRVVSYEAFRDKWRHAVVAIFAFGAFFSPPDPITQIMWAVPLIGLYAFSLKLSQFAQLLRRSSDEVSFAAVARKYWNRVGAVVVLAGGGVYLFFTRGGVAAVNDVTRSAPKSFRPDRLPGLAEATGLELTLAAGIAGALGAVVAFVGTVFYFSIRELDAARDPTEPTGSPADIDLSKLDAAAIAVTPPERFEDMDEGEATELAREALHEEDDPEKAQAILDRYDEVQERLEAEEEADEDPGDITAADAAPGSQGVTPGNAAGPAPGGDDEKSTTAGIVDAFTEDETTDEDIGGYYTDIAFILESLTSKAFRIAGVFGLVMAASFVYLYRGGIGEILDVFSSQMSEAGAGQLNLATLHPVEALVFEVKVSTLLGFLAALPVALYYMWPRLRERGVVRGDQRVIAVWGVTLFVGVIGGSLIGFFYVAPAVISWLAQDAVGAHMDIRYRVNSFGWLVIFTTVGVGLLMEIPVTMFLFHRGGVVSFTTMFDRWRTVVMAIVVAAALLTPSSLFTMIVFAVPTAAAYLFGLAVLWVYTLGGRRTPARREGEAAD